MSDHFDTEDSRTDLTDLCIFAAAGRADASVLVLDVNPEASADEVSVDPAASYEIKIDTNGDLEADVAFHVLFDVDPNDVVSATVYRATGAEARGIGRVGEVVIASARVPNDGFGTPIDEGGYRFTFNKTEADVLAFDETSPAEQRSRFGERFVAFLMARGYPEPEARERVGDYLPDVLAYDASKAPGFPNGRRLTDDTADLLVALLTRGQITSDLAGPHTDLLDDFPYLGPPHPPELALRQFE